MPRSRAYLTASEVLETSSFSMMFCRWVLTVFALIYSDVPPVWWTQDEAMVFWFQEVFRCRRSKGAVNTMGVSSERRFV